MFSIGKYFAATNAGIDPRAIGSALSRAEVIKIANGAWQEFRRSPYPELLSCFDQTKLIPLIGLQVDENEREYGIDALVAAIDCGDLTQVFTIMKDSIGYALYVLLQNPNSEIHEIMVTDGLTPEAEPEYVALARKFQARPRPKDLRGLSPEEVAQVLAPAAAPVVSTVALALSPTEQCAADYAGPNAIPGDKFKVKYLDNQDGRRIYDQACAEGKI